MGVALASLEVLAHPKDGIAERGPGETKALWGLVGSGKVFGLKD